MSLGVLEDAHVLRVPALADRHAAEGRAEVDADYVARLRSGATLRRSTTARSAAAASACIVTHRAIIRLQGAEKTYVANKRIGATERIIGLR